MFNLESIFLSIPGVMIALIFSGYGHALCAHLMGDNTPKMNGQLSLSPNAHLDPIGFFCLLIASFGWSKPVVVNPNNFKNKRYGLALYFISGSIANIITAALFLWILKIIYSLNIGFDKLYNILQLTVSINIGYSAIQLLPIPPFSGYYFIRQLLPQHIAVKLYPLERYSMIIFLILIMTGVSSILIQPLYEMITKFVFILAGMNV